MHHWMSLVEKLLDVGLVALLSAPPSQDYDNVAVAFRMIAAGMARAGPVGRELVRQVLPREMLRLLKR